MFRNNSFFSLESPSKKKIIVSAYLTLLTLSYLANLATGSTQAAIDCEKLLEHMYDNDGSPGSALAGAMIFGPIGLLLGGGRNREEIAKELSSQGICTDYIEEKYHFNQLALEQQKIGTRWLASQREREQQADERYITRAANCKANYGEQGISQLICTNPEATVVIGVLFLVTAFMFIAERPETHGKNNTPNINSSSQVKKTKHH